MAHLISDYADFVTRMKDLVDVAISKVSDENGKKQLEEKLNTILETSTTNDYGKDKSRKYEHLMRDSFKINIVMRIELTNYINSIYNKIGDLTFETINKLIKEGECDAWFSIIQNDINNMELAG